MTTLTGHAGRILDTTFSPDCRSIVSSATDSLIKVWQPDLDRNYKKKQMVHDKSVNAVDVCNGMVATASSMLSNDFFL